jgi:hypothetical protein
MKNLFFNLSLTPREKIAFRLHLLYSSFEGVILGVLALNEFVFIKSMAGKPMQLAFLFQFSMLVFLFSAFVNRLFTSAKRIRKLIRIAAITTRLPLILFLFFPPEIVSDHQFYNYAFLGAFFIYYLANPLIYPNINFFLKNSYQHHNFGFLYSMSTSLNKIIMMVVTFVYGILLDADPMVFRFVLPVVGVLAVLSAFLLTMIPYRDKQNVEERGRYAGKNFISSAKEDIIGTLMQNKPFLLFQVAFMFYGLAFMIGTPSTNIFYKEILDLNYSSVAFYRNVYNIIAIVILPFMGRMLGRAGPMKFGMITFSSLLFYFVFVLLSGLFPSHFYFLNIKVFHMMLIALLFHGMFASTMSLLWNIGSAYFGKDQDASRFQNVHLFLTGVRAIPAPILGVWIYETWGFVACFSLSAFLLIAGVFVIRSSLKKPG